MGLEVFGNIDALNPNWPLTDDFVNEGDNHLRGVKSSLQRNVTGDDDETRLKVTGDLVGAVAREDGLHVFGRATVPSDAFLLVYNEADQTVAKGGMQYDSADNRLRVGAPLGPATGVKVSLEGKRSDGSQQRLIESAQDTATVIYYGDNTERARATNLGFDFSGSRFNMVDSVAQTTRYGIRNPAGGMSYDVLSSGNIRISQLTAANVREHDWLQLNRDGDVVQFHNGQKRAATLLDGYAFTGDAGQAMQLGASSPGDQVVSLAFWNTWGGYRWDLDTGSNNRGAFRYTNNAGVALDDLATFDRNAGWEFMFATVGRLRTRSYGSETTGQHRVTDPAPLDNADLTRKDYVDGRAFSNVGERRLRVQNVQVIGGIITDTGASGSVVFAQPFTSAPAVVIAQADGNPASEQNIQVSNVTINGFDWADQSGGLNQKHWLAIGGENT